MGSKKKNKRITIASLFGFEQFLAFKRVEKKLYMVLFLTALAIVYIWNTHHTEKMIRKIDRANRELKEMRWEYMSKKSELMNLSKQSQVAKYVEPLGLKDLRTPPYIITDRKK